MHDFRTIGRRGQETGRLMGVFHVVLHMTTSQKGNTERYVVNMSSIEATRVESQSMRDSKPTSRSGGLPSVEVRSTRHEPTRWEMADSPVSQTALNLSKPPMPYPHIQYTVNSPFAPNPTPPDGPLIPNSRQIETGIPSHSMLTRF